MIGRASRPKYETFRIPILAGKPSPITYNSPKAKEILEEDKIIEKFPFKIDGALIQVIPADKVFE